MPLSESMPQREGQPIPELLQSVDDGSLALPQIRWHSVQPVATVGGDQGVQ